MRHKVAIGISERSDAEVIVISEQRGTISFVRDGIISQIDNIGELKLKLEPPKPQEDLNRGQCFQNRTETWLDRIRQVFRFLHTDYAAKGWKKRILHKSR